MYICKNPCGKSSLFLCPMSFHKVLLLITLPRSAGNSALSRKSASASSIPVDNTITWNKMRTGDNNQEYPGVETSLLQRFSCKTFITDKKAVTKVIFFSSRERFKRKEILWKMHGNVSGCLSKMFWSPCKAFCQGFTEKCRAQQF